MTQDAMQLKEKIISFIQLRGPSLPVHIAKETGLSILFASAFLSELFNEKRINISNLKVGSSPLYFISGQEPQLENFSKYIKSKEKEAFLLLKEKRILKDSELHPAIRVALREIRDFAIPFKKDKKKKQNKKMDENFFNKIKEFLEKKNIEILDIKDFRNNEAILKIKKG